MAEISWLRGTSSAFRLMIATSWLAPDSWRQRQEETIREAIAAGPDWDEYLRLAAHHRTTALSWSALKRVPGLEIPESARQQLQERSDAWQSHAARLSLRLVRVLKGFARAGIPVMPFKGPTLSFEVYRDERLRQYRDLDLAVTPEDLPRSQACLEKMGWHLKSTWFPLTTRQWESFLRHEHHLNFVHRHGPTELELHWRNTWDSTDSTNARWARSIPSVWQRCSHRAMNPIDQVLYLCSHGGKHAWYRAYWLGDLARIHAEGRVDWQQAFEQAQSTGQQRPLLAGLRLLKELYRLSLPDLPGDPWKNLPSFLIRSPLRALKSAKEPVAESRSLRDPFHERIRMTRYNWLVQPSRGWGEILSDIVYDRRNFKVLSLPDRLFWAYAPLYPILCAWRRARRGSRNGTS
jgi:hypothetical protein